MTGRIDAMGRRRLGEGGILHRRAIEIVGIGGMIGDGERERERERVCVCV